MAASATFALKAGVWFRRGRLFIVSADSLAQRARCQAETPLIVLFRFLRPALFIQRFCYRQLLYFVVMQTLLTAIKGTLVGWGKLVRTGSVHIPVGRVLNS